MLLAGLLEARACAFDARALAVHLGAQLADQRRVHELLDRQRLVDVAQLLHDQAAQADQEAGEDEGDEPQGPLHPLFGQAQAFAHEALLGDGQARSLPSSRAPCY